MKNVVEKRNKIKKSKAQKIVFGVVFVIFFVYAVMLLYPLFFAFTASLIENGRVYAKDPLAISIPPYFINYVKAMGELKVRSTDFFGMFVNSLWWAFGATALTILSSAMMAYIVSRYNFRGKMFLYNMVLIVMIMPLYGTESAKYRLLDRYIQPRAEYYPQEMVVMFMADMMFKEDRLLSIRALKTAISLESIINLKL